MSHRQLVLSHLLILLVVALIIGCQKESGSDNETPKDDQIAQQASGKDTNDTSVDASAEKEAPTDPEDEREIDLAQLPPLQPRPGADATKILKEMAQTYKEADSYADFGYIELKYELPGGIVETERRICTFAYVKPNKVRMEIHRGQLVSDGTLFAAQAAGNSELFGQVIEKRSPAQITIKDLYGDFHLAGLMDLGVPPEVIFFPPQVVLLFAQDSLQTFVPEGSDVFMGQPEYVLSRDGLAAYRCDKVEVVDKLTGRRTYWIEWDTHILMRMEIDVERIRDSEVKPLAIKIELQDAVLDPPEIGNEAFMMRKPMTSTTVSEFMLPELAMLGKVPDGTICFDAEKQAVSLASPTQKSVAVAVLFVTDPQAADACQAALQILQRLSVLYADNPNVHCFPVSVDPATISDAIISETLKSWGIGIPYLRQSDQEMMTRLGLTDVPTFVVLGPNGLLQLVNSGLLPSETLSQFVDSALAGNNPYQSILNIFQGHKSRFHQAIDDFVAYDIFRTEPEHVQIADRTEPKTFSLSESWRRTDLVSPGNPHVISLSLIIPHDFQKISVIGGTDGRTLVANANNDPATFTPQGISPDMPLHFLRSAEAPDGQRYFVVTGINQRQLFVFDKDMNQVMTWPQPADAGKFEIAAVQMADLTGDDVPEIVIGYRVLAESSQRLGVIDLTGKMIWEDQTVTEPDQVAVVLKNKVPYVWVINRFYNETNALVEFDRQGKKLREWHIDPVGGLIWKIFAADLDRDGNSEVLTVLPREGEMVVAGVNTDARVGTEASQKPLLWEHTISPGSHGVKSFEFVVDGDIDGDAFNEWCVAAADGTISFIDKSGRLLDDFATGEALSGMAVLADTKTSTATLVLTTSKDHYDNSIARDAVIALEIVRENATPQRPPATPATSENAAPPVENSPPPSEPETLSINETPLP